MSTPYCLPLSFNLRSSLYNPISKPYHHHHSLSTTLVCSSSLSPNSTSNHEREEPRWLREEQRWLREEQRWLREESTWHAQRESLNKEVSALKLKTRTGLVLEAMPEDEREREIVLASLGEPEDEIMTAELHEELYTEHQFEYSLLMKEDPKGIAIPEEGASGSAAAFITKNSKKIVENKKGKVNEVCRNRVFLLGENRWEEPSRLTESKWSITKCISCRGEGRIFCAECDGSGEPNIEPQFLEWVDEKMKCPYCHGIGFATCDVCDGKSEAFI